MNNSIIVANRGREVKFRVIFNDDTFDKKSDPVEIVLRWGLLGRKTVIRREDMIFNEDGEVYIIVDTSKMTGIVTATCYYEINDIDMPDEMRTEVDEQPLMYVATGRISCCRPRCGCKCPGSEEHDVEYRYVSDTNVGQSFYYLITTDEFYLEPSDESLLTVPKHN